MSFAPYLDAAQAYRDAARAALIERLATRRIDEEQRAAHGFAWVATSVAALEAMAAWCETGGGANPLDAMVSKLAFAETLAQLVGGLPMGQNEFARPADLGLGAAARSLADACADLLDADHAPTRAALAAALAEGAWPSEIFHDPDLDTIRDQFRRFTEAEIMPHAHQWHLANALIPDATVRAMAELGTFGVCISRKLRRAWPGKLAMCVVTEELRAAGSAPARSARARKSPAN